MCEKTVVGKETVRAENIGATSAVGNDWQGEINRKNSPEGVDKRSVSRYTDSIAEDSRITERQRRKRFRRGMNRLGGSMLLYELFMYAMAFVVLITQGLVILLVRGGRSKDVIPQLMESGVCYLIIIAFGFLFVSKYLRKSRMQEAVTSSRRPMTAARFIGLLACFYSVKTILVLFVLAVEIGLHAGGFTMKDEMQAATAGSRTISMFLYAGIGAPVFEEWLFRGAILQSLKKYGKMFAITASAILFGVFHGNLAQGILATVCGMILGYVAMEYSLKWSILMHVLNNLVFGDLLLYLTKGLSAVVQDYIDFGIMGIFLICGLFMVIRNRARIKAYIQRNRTGRKCYRYLFTSAGILLFIFVNIVISFMGISRL